MLNSICSRMLLSVKTLERNFKPVSCINCIFKAYSSSSKQKNHYDVLNLPRSCTPKDIRNAFISLSKQYHPDKNKGDSKAQEKFVRVNEAYNVLIKPESRQDYDVKLRMEHFGPAKVYKSPNENDYYEVHRYKPNYDPWSDPSFARNRKFSDTNSEDYYGFKGVKKQSNQRLVYILIIVTGIGVALQILVIRFSRHRQLEELKARHERSVSHLEEVKARAHELGTRERQIEDFKRRAGLVESNSDA